MRRPQVRQPQGSPSALHERAIADLSYIRDTMERAGSFTAVSGWGQTAVGVMALGAAAFASRQGDPTRWMAIWFATAAVSAAISLEACRRKARRAGEGLFGG